MTAPNEDDQHHIIQPAKKAGITSRLRTYFLTGLAVAAPIWITIYLLRWFVEFIDTYVVGFFPDQYQPDQLLPFTVPGIGVIIGLVGLTFLGALTANFLGRRILAFGERLVDRMPIVRNIYNALKQIFETVISQSGTSFRDVGLIEYPRRGLYALVFVTTQTKGEVLEKASTDDEMVSVFLPTTPNPTSGFLLFVPKADITILDMSVEEAAKLVISAGLVEPPNGEGNAIPLNQPDSK
ncbi:MAG: hypothetical protein CMI60_19395 [Parvibaculum sp.]|jgi:uncharacterized membrane protein|nr:hypothetical protein [Parvibaculum sp.]|tara:strand:+ start:463 stop:1176 length:714 start_codon:yes stop_codon:yes gene_type:complete